MKSKLILCSLAVGLLFVTTMAHAMDIGILTPTDKKFRAEIYYEQFERDIEQEYGFSGGSYDGLQEEDRIVARVTFNPQRWWGLSLEVGGADSKASEDIAPIFGAGAHIVLFEQGGFYTSAFGHITWVTGIEYKDHYGATDGVNYFDETWTREEEYLEYGLGAQLGYIWQPCSGARVTGYAGAMASWLDDTKSEEHASGGYFIEGMAEPTSYAIKSSSVDMDESQVAQFFAGVEMALLPLDGGVRVEGRFYDRTSLTASLFWNF
ncbi:hypothetical protein [Desulfuromonas thiophila]|uniref:hypothetical protein n=1 Tax=Desulfuromonas thiophila TaxID=57664 RepID=UPI0024A7BDBC|nr:hypothetical protein [Desulfuromonas thiophila]